MGLLREGSRFKDEVKEILNLVGKYKKTKSQELRNVVYSLIKSTQAIEESSRKTTRIEMAKNLLKVKFSADIIFRATGLSADEYDNTEEEIRTDSADYKVGQRIKEVRLIRRYTQEDLANKIGISQQQIQKYERGVNRTLTGKLYDIAKALSVKVEVLLPEIEEGCYEGGNSKTEKELSSLIRGYQKIKSQAARDRFNVLAESLCEGMLVIKEEVSRAERIQVANNLLILGISIDVISQTTGLSADEIA